MTTKESEKTKESLSEAKNIFLGANFAFGLSFFKKCGISDDTLNHHPDEEGKPKGSKISAGKRSAKLSK